MTDFTGLLDESRRATLERLTQLRADHDGIVAASRDSNADDEHDPEGATIGFERAQLAATSLRASHDDLATR